MIKALIENYETLTVVGVFALIMAWYLWHQTRAQSSRESKRDAQQLKREEKHDKQQNEDRAFHRELMKGDRKLIENDLKSIHSISLENSKLNSQSVTLVKDISKNLKEHNSHSRKAWKKTIESLSAVCDKLNGKNPEKKDNKADGRKK